MPRRGADSHQAGPPRLPALVLKAHSLSWSLGCIPEKIPGRTTITVCLQPPQQKTRGQSLMQHTPACPPLPPRSVVMRTTCCKTKPGRENSLARLEIAAGTAAGWPGTGGRPGDGQGCCSRGHGGGEPADWPGPIEALSVSAVWGCSRLFSNLANAVWPRQELLTQGKAKEQQSGWLISSISTHIPPTRSTKFNLRDLPGDSVVETPCLQCSGHGFNP